MVRACLSLTELFKLLGLDFVISKTAPILQCFKNGMKIHTSVWHTTDSEESGFALWLHQHHEQAPSDHGAFSSALRCSTAAVWGEHPMAFPKWNTAFGQYYMGNATQQGRHKGHF